MVKAPGCQCSPNSGAFSASSAPSSAAYQRKAAARGLSIYPRAQATAPISSRRARNAGGDKKSGKGNASGTSNSEGDNVQVTGPKHSQSAATGARSTAKRGLADKCA